MSKKTSVTVEQTSELNGMLTAIDTGNFSCDGIVESVQGIAKAERSAEKAGANATLKNSEFAADLDAIAMAMRGVMVPVTLMSHATSISDARWLETHPEYSAKELQASRALFNFVRETCKENGVKFQAIAKNSAFYTGKGQTDSAIVRGEELGVIEAGTMETIQAKRDSKGVRDKVRAAARKAEAAQLRTEPAKWVHAQLNTLIGTLQGENPANESVQRQNEQAVEILNTACSELLQD